MSEETKKTSEEQEAEKEIPVTDGDQEEENLTPEGEDLPEEENNTPGEEAASEDKKQEKSKTSFFGKKKKSVSMWITHWRSTVNLWRTVRSPLKFSSKTKKKPICFPRADGLPAISFFSFSDNPWILWNRTAWVRLFLHSADCSSGNHS